MPAGVPVTTGPKAPKPALPFPNTDLTIRRREAVLHLPKGAAEAAKGMLKDERDLHLLETLLSILLIVPSSAALVFLAPWWQLKAVLGVAHAAMVFVGFASRFILGLHYWSHAPMNSVWKKGTPFAAALQAIPTVVIAPFFGIPAGLYHLHHIAMHHRDNNMAPNDLSSTMPYQRNSCIGFLHYWARYTFMGMVEVPLHSLRTGNMRLFAQGISGTVFWVFKVWFLSQFDALATIFVFVVPFFVASLALMFGNWSQHIFIDPDAYEAGAAKDDDLVNYKLTFNTVNSAENAFSFNDGYHIVHHRWASLHWMDMPKRFMEDLATHAAQDALLFRDADPIAVGFMVMTGNWDWVVDRYVHYGQTPKPRTRDEILAELKRRLVPIPTGDKAKTA